VCLDVVEFLQCFIYGFVLLVLNEHSSKISTDRDCILYNHTHTGHVTLVMFSLRIGCVPTARTWCEKQTSV